ncbi:hypothetical protein HP456_12540 [Bacillus haikouensis]|jgi:hypothetical protein|uniref:hypothetical protein n=1 Tax=Bacillus haikouensis TaxID=1510468 RepID=UPI001555C0F9|nr:hypothetical protein [Bacillus haikouensis]NQD66748.1 hypothetical protein [Bacillus haikouensis]
MRKGILRVFVSCLIFLAIYMVTHRPSEEQFYTWIQEKYKIDCKEKLSCTKKADEKSVHTLIETGSNIKNEYLLFNTIGKVYEDKNGDKTVIKAIGVCGKYFAIINDGISK